MSAFLEVEKKSLTPLLPKKKIPVPK